MKLLSAIALVAIGCGGSKKPAPAPAPVVAPAPAPPPDTCPQDSAKLGQWLTDVVTDGHGLSLPAGLKLAVAPSAVPMDIADAPTVQIAADVVSFQGVVVAQTKKPVAAALKKAFADPKLGPNVTLLIDGSVPWSSVGRVIKAVAAGHPHLTFVFTAGTPGHATPPPASSIDADAPYFDPAGKATPLRDPADKSPTVADKVFKDCPDAVTYMKTLSNGAAALADGLPKAIKACDCKVEIPAVEHLAWIWFGRDRGSFAGVSLDTVAKGGAKLTAKPEIVWSDIAQSVFDAGAAGKPVTIN